ncbi:MAG: glycosyltransferase family 1 protein [Patescibacteria group bacterium]
MKIGIDCRTILNPEKGEAAGVGHYTYQLVRHLLEIDKDNFYVLFFDRDVANRRLSKFEKENVEIKFFPFVQYKKFLPQSYSNFLASAFLAKEELDIFHSPTANLPSSYSYPSIITIHDLAVYKFPELYPEKERKFLYSTISSAVKQAQKIIAVSQSTKKDIQDIFSVESKNIKLIYHGIDKRFFGQVHSAEVEKVKTKLGIATNYILFLGTLDSRKNIFRIIEAYERLRDKLVELPQVSRTEEQANINHLLSKYQLVLAGRPGNQYDQIFERINDSRYKDDILLPGYINPEDLDPLFQGAKFFIFPSLYEGFGLPILEAMADGIPVITSNISSMPEIAKGRAILVDPLNVSEIAQAMSDLLTDAHLWRDLSQSGRERAKEFSWENTAKETLKFYQETAKITVK